MSVILVVEDSPTVSHTVKGILSRHGYTVNVAGDGLIALRALRTFEPDLMLLDIRLPHIDGFQLCRVVRRLEKFADLPIVILSSLSSDDDIRRALEAGADTYLTKPIDERRLIQAVEDQLARQPVPSYSDFLQ